MSYKLGNVPTTHSSLSEIADFMEIECLKSTDSSYSSLQAAQTIGLVDDEYIENNSEDDEKYQKCNEALAEIENRMSLCNGKYPFKTNKAGIFLNGGISKESLLLYTFLLLATRDNMIKEGKIAGGIDGTALFESICALIAKEYFGANSESFVFGTGGNSNSFEDKVKDLFRNLAEKGYTFCKPIDHPNTDKDGKVDVVTFIPFKKDVRKGQFLAFTQCKTGTNWRQTLGITDGNVFSRMYVNPPFRFTPIVLFMVAESIDKDFESLCLRSKGILFDRCRLMNYMPHIIPASIIDKISIWNQTILRNYA